MPLSNTIKRFKFLTLIIVLCTISLSCFSQDSNLLDPVSLKNRMMEMLPIENRSPDNLQDIEDLYDDLQIAEIYTIDDLTNLINTYLQEVLIIEKDICQQMIQSEDSELSASVTTGSYSADLEDLESIEKGIYFTTVGLIRTMIDLRHQTDEDTETDIE